MKAHDYGNIGVDSAGSDSDFDEDDCIVSLDETKTPKGSRFVLVPFLKQLHLCFNPTPPLRPVWSGG